MTIRSYFCKPRWSCPGLLVLKAAYPTGKLQGLFRGGYLEVPVGMPLARA